MCYDDDGDDDDDDDDDKSKKIYKNKGSTINWHSVADKM